MFAGRPGRVGSEPVAESGRFGSKTVQMATRRRPSTPMRSRLPGLSPEALSGEQCKRPTRDSNPRPSACKQRPWSSIVGTLPCYFAVLLPFADLDGYGQFAVVSASFGQKDRLVCPFSHANVRCRLRTRLTARGASDRGRRRLRGGTAPVATRLSRAQRGPDSHTGWHPGVRASLVQERTPDWSRTIPLPGFDLGAKFLGTTTPKSRTAREKPAGGGPEYRG